MISQLSFCILAKFLENMVSQRFRRWTEELSTLQGERLESVLFGLFLSVEMETWFVFGWYDEFCKRQINWAMANPLVCVRLQKPNKEFSSIA